MCPRCEGERVGGCEWGVDWDDAPPGPHAVLARAADGRGVFQTADERDPLPRGATGYHHATFDVRA